MRFSVCTIVEVRRRMEKQRLGGLLKHYYR